jgi:hypothetical protein
VLGFQSYDLSKNKAVIWRSTMKAWVKIAFIKQEKCKHSKFTCRDSGFVICKEYPFLGVSSDSMTECACHRAECLEIKCPYKHRDNTIAVAVQNDTTFCMEFRDGKYQLKPRHWYYTQVQMQMYICIVARI